MEKKNSFTSTNLAKCWYCDNFGFVLCLFSLLIESKLKLKISGKKSYYFWSELIPGQSLQKEMSLISDLSDLLLYQKII